MKFVLASALLATATAFTPSNSPSTTTSLSASKYAGELGVQKPLGYFDPLGVMNVDNDEKFTFFREVEIVHGRVAVRSYCFTIEQRKEKTIHIPCV